MDRQDPDRDLRPLFTAARRAEAARTPDFDRMWPAASERRRPRVTPFRLAVAGAAAAVALVFALFPRESGPPVPTDAPYALSFGWRGPTDFLLDTPGGELFSTVPDFGATGSPPWPDLGDELTTTQRTEPKGG